jgi:hypothetical protein
MVKSARTSNLKLRTQHTDPYKTLMMLEDGKVSTSLHYFLIKFPSTLILSDTISDFHIIACL